MLLAKVPVQPHQTWVQPSIIDPRITLTSGLYPKSVVFLSLPLPAVRPSERVIEPEQSEAAVRFKHVSTLSVSLSTPSRDAEYKLLFNLETVA